MNPYEIRLELLKLSRDILSDAKSIEIQRKVDSWSAQLAHAEKYDKPIPDFPIIDQVTTEDVLKEANKLNKFISND